MSSATYTVSATPITNGVAENNAVTIVSTLQSRNSCLATNLSAILEDDRDLVIYIGSVEMFRCAIMSVSGLTGATPTDRFTYFMDTLVSY